MGGMTKTAALVLETHNLRGGGAGAARVEESLRRVLEKLCAQSRPLSTLQDVVVTHDGLDPEAQQRLEAAAGVPLRFVRTARDDDYYAAKNAGFDATRADVVVFADADCWPDPDWLEHLVAPFEADDAPSVVAGRTTYPTDLLGTAATTLDFLYYESPFGRRFTRNFYANNVAFARETFAPRRFPSAPTLYRGHCQMLGMRLEDDGVPILFEPRARTIHRFPDTARELLALRILRGQDTTEMTPLFASRFAPKPLRALGRVAPIAPLAVLGFRLSRSLAAVGHQDMPAVRGARAAACLAAIVGLSAVDAVGACARSVGLSLVGDRDRASLHALSYHAQEAPTGST